MEDGVITLVFSSPHSYGEWATFRGPRQYCWRLARQYVTRVAKARETWVVLDHKSDRGLQFAGERWFRWRPPSIFPPSPIPAGRWDEITLKTPGDTFIKVAPGLCCQWGLAQELAKLASEHGRACANGAFGHLEPNFFILADHGKVVRSSRYWRKDAIELGRRLQREGVI